MGIYGDLQVMADIGFPKTADRIRKELSRQHQAVMYSTDLFDQMNDERKRQDAEIERLRETLTTILNYDVEGNIRATARDAINAGAWNEGNDIKSYCDEIEGRICKVLGGGDD